MKHFEPKDIPIVDVFKLILSGVSPRPIALVATMSENGKANLSPFSFFNAFGCNPPYVAFSPSSRVRDGSRKDTYYNLVREKECTIQAVTYDMVEQVSLASTEYDTGVDEFVKSGLTPIPSDLVGAPRVKESPFQMECLLEKEVSLGDGKGSGNLMICRVVKFHVAEEVYGENGIDPHRLDLVARGGANYYTRASGNAIFEVEKPIQTKGIGYDRLPGHIRVSDVFSANNLAKLANVETVPGEAEVEALVRSVEGEVAMDGQRDPLRVFARLQRMGDYRGMFSVGLQCKGEGHVLATRMIEQAAKEALERNDIDFAWKAALSNAPQG
ncbi:MAG: flavin reductase family protein [bacterium]|nr:flavin reductase family protein [bacterium]